MGKIRTIRFKLNAEKDASIQSKSKSGNGNLDKKHSRVQSGYVSRFSLGSRSQNLVAVARNGFSQFLL